MSCTFKDIFGLNTEMTIGKPSILRKAHVCYLGLYEVYINIYF